LGLPLSPQTEVRRCKLLELKKNIWKKEEKLKRYNFGQG
jgi:hypothetical protein